MYVCICKGINEASIIAAVKNGAQRLRDVRLCLGACDQCGKCAEHTHGLIKETLARLDESQPKLGQSL